VQDNLQDSLQDNRPARPLVHPLVRLRRKDPRLPAVAHRPAEAEAPVKRRQQAAVAAAAKQEQPAAAECSSRSWPSSSRSFR
jgi:hypothetical protein